MKILHLTLKRKWFDLIALGEKKHEFRECKPYWERRLIDDSEDGEGKVFDIVRFKNGYGKYVPTMDVEFRHIAFTSNSCFTPKHGEKIWPHTIVITLGKVLETVNYNNRFHSTSE